MIPLVDDYLQLMIADKLKWLKDHSVVIEHIFSTGKRETLAKLREFIENKKLKVIIGFPQNQTSLPAYVITLAPENEQPAGLGDNSGTYGDWDLGIGEDSEDYSVQEAVAEIKKFIAGTYMNSTYRIECWSDNGDLTAYMYTILKWCLWSSRQQMLDLGWVNITMSGMDLEPVPDYMPVFIYRRASQISLTYENLYYENVEALEGLLDVIDHPDEYHKDEDGNIVDENNNIIIPKQYTWIIRAHYYNLETGVVTSSVEYTYSQIEMISQIMDAFTKEVCEIDPKTGLPIFPEIGKSNVIYLVPIANSSDEENLYEEYLYIDGQYEKIGQDLSDYATLEILKSRYKELQEYVDAKTSDIESFGVTEISSNEVLELFNKIF